MTTPDHALADITAISTDLTATELRRVDLMEKARALGATAQQVADAAGMAPATYYRLAGKRRSENVDPARYRQLAPKLAIDQPTDGLTVAVGTSLTEPPATAFTFNAANPVLLLLADDVGSKEAVQDVWHVMATSVAVSDARVRIYGRPPHRPGCQDLPNYLGVWGEFDGHLDLVSEFASRAARIAAGEDLPPILVRLLVDRDGLRVVNTALAFGHQARIYLIAETWRWHPSLALIPSVLAFAGARDGGWKSVFAIPRIPASTDFASLTTPEGVQDLVLPSPRPPA